MPRISTGVASLLPSSRRPRHQFGCAAGNQAVDLDGERRRVERQRAPAHGVCGVEMLHGQGVVAKIVRRLADREVKPQALRRVQPRRGQGGFHPLKQTVVIARDTAAADQIVVASRQQRRDRDRALEAFAGLVETAELREQIAQQIMRHGVASDRAPASFAAPVRLPDCDPRSAAPAALPRRPKLVLPPVAAARRKQPIASSRWPSV